MSFHVMFQCKRYKGSVGAGEIRDFRGENSSTVRLVILLNAFLSSFSDWYEKSFMIYTLDWVLCGSITLVYDKVYFAKSHLDHQ